ncbi:MAG: hypothetical protein U9R00_00955 [Patescibacteria group bacterium]|nr:hypothetical protein [Patescibacteria group bacterium]
MKENIFENKTQNSIEKSGNYEGNETLLFQELLQNPEIRDQLINTYLHYYETQDRPFLIQEFDENGNGIDVTNQWEKTIKTKEQINEELNQKMKTTFSQTEIDYSKKSVSCMNDDFGFGTISFQSINSQTNEKYSKKQLSIIEAHEKGHFLRDFRDPGQLFKSEILKGLDFSKVKLAVSV